MSRERKIAVITGQVAEHGIPIINNLLEEDYQVFLMTLYQSEMMYARGVSPDVRLNLVHGSGRTLEEWRTLEKEIQYYCATEDYSTPKVDLLINMVEVGKPSTPSAFTVFDLEYAMSNTVHPLFLAMPIFAPLLEATGESQVINIYPDAPEEGASPMSSLGDVIAKAAADALTKQLIKSVEGTGISIDSLCYPLAGVTEDSLVATVQRLKRRQSKFNGIWKISTVGKITTVVMQEDFT